MKNYKGPLNENPERIVFGKFCGVLSVDQDSFHRCDYKAFNGNQPSMEWAWIIHFQNCIQKSKMVATEQVVEHLLGTLWKICINIFVSVER